MFYKDAAQINCCLLSTDDIEQIPTDPEAVCGTP
jgi:hypothetical protein